MIARNVAFVSNGVQRGARFFYPLVFSVLGGVSRPIKVSLLHYLQLIIKETNTIAS